MAEVAPSDEPAGDKERSTTPKQEGSEGVLLLMYCVVVGILILHVNMCLHAMALLACCHGTISSCTPPFGKYIVHLTLLPSLIKLMNLSLYNTNNNKKLRPQERSVLSTCQC